ncbi:hypothetical protein [Acinetobacter pittii]|uniref:hypothetical protein n=1 Tax=Acinetobacter pittii TaxID=48296 RepID=UPI003B9B9FA7
MEELKKSFSLRKLPWGWILLGITLWFLFPWIFSVFFNLIIKNPKEYGESFGAVGDIYGSLNALISSIALCAVAYSTWLQVTSLKESRKVNEQQLNLAINNHEEQVRESRNAIFANQFYSLLNFKKDRLNNLSLIYRHKNEDGDELTKLVPGLHVIEDIAEKFIEILTVNNDEFKGKSKEMLKSDFLSRVRYYGYGSISFLSSYFRLYFDLCSLIRNSELTKSEKDFYKKVLSNSMFHHEQIVLFWIAPIISEFDLQDSEIFTLFDQFSQFKNFALEFHEDSHFKSETWKNYFS